jgi:Phosphotransferase system, mannose/fructose/N-acetylgalactosamine-specific component IIB
VVNLLRVDARLLHGQVAVTWISDVNATSILIADDAVMKDEMAKIALKMAKPADMKLAIRSIDGAAELLNDPRSNDISIFVIVRTIEDALKLVEKTNCIHRINIGGIKKKEGSKLIAPAVYVNEDEIATLSKLTDLVGEVEFRMVPSDSPRSAKSLINK